MSLQTAVQDTQALVPERDWPCAQTMALSQFRRQTESLSFSSLSPFLAPLAKVHSCGSSKQLLFILEYKLIWGDIINLTLEMSNQRNNANCQ